MIREPYITDTGVVFHKKRYQCFPMDGLPGSADVSWILFHNSQAFCQDTIPPDFVRLRQVPALKMAYLPNGEELVDKSLFELLAT